MCSCNNSKLRSQPIMTRGVPVTKSIIVLNALVFSLYTDNMDKQKKDIEDKTRHKRKWIRKKTYQF